MKAANNIILRIIFAFVLGILLIIRSSTVVNYLVITIGVLFLVPGLISIFGYLFQGRQSPERKFPLESIGSCLLGLALIIVPDFFVGALMYILSGVLILAGFFQIYGLFITRRHLKVPFFFYIIPAIILLIGIVILFNPFTVAETTFMVMGITCVIYSLSELFNYIKFRKNQAEIN